MEEIGEIMFSTKSDWRQLHLEVQCRIQVLNNTIILESAIPLRYSFVSLAIL